MGVPVRPHIHQLGGEIGIHRRTSRVQSRADRAGDFQIPLQRRRGIHQHILPRLHLPLIRHALRDNQRAAAPRWHRIRWIIYVSIGRFVARRRGGQPARAVPRVGRSIGVQVISGVMRPGQRPVRFRPPAVFAHHENQRRRLVHQPGFNVFQPVIKPAQQVFVQLDARFGAEINIAGIAGSGRGIGADVRPRPHQQPLPAPRPRSGRLIPQRLIAVQRPLQKYVVPRTHMEHRQVNAMRLPQQVNAPPVRPIPFLIEILREIRRRLPHPPNPVAQGQVSKPGIGQRLGEVIRRQHILVHLRQQIPAPRPPQRVAPLMNGVSHHPPPLHRPAGMINPALVKIRRRRHRRHAAQMRRTRPGRQRVLRRPQVRLPGSRHPPVAPRLPCRPLHRIVAVLPLLKQRIIIIALGIEPGAAILADHHIPALREKPDGMLLIIGIPILPIRPPGNQRRKPPRRIRPVNIRRQPHPIPHRHHNITLANHPILPNLRHNRPLSTQLRNPV